MKNPPLFHDGSKKFLQLQYRHLFSRENRGLDSVSPQRLSPSNIGGLLHRMDTVIFWYF